MSLGVGNTARKAPSAPLPSKPPEAPHGVWPGAKVLQFPRTANPLRNGGNGLLKSALRFAPLARVFLQRVVPVASVGVGVYVIANSIFNKWLGWADWAGNKLFEIFLDPNDFTDPGNTQRAQLHIENKFAIPFAKVLRPLAFANNGPNDPSKPSGEVPPEEVNPEDPSDLVPNAFLRELYLAVQHQPGELDRLQAPAVQDCKHCGEKALAHAKKFPGVPRATIGFFDQDQTLQHAALVLLVEGEFYVYDPDMRNFFPSNSPLYDGALIAIAQDKPHAVLPLKAYVSLYYSYFKRTLPRGGTHELGFYDPATRKRVEWKEEGEETKGEMAEVFHRVFRDLAAVATIKRDEGAMGLLKTMGGFLRVLGKEGEPYKDEVGVNFYEFAKSGNLSLSGKPFQIFKDRIREVVARMMRENPQLGE